METVIGSNKGLSPGPSVSGGRQIINDDERTLTRLGRKQQLKRNFGYLSVLGFSCTILVTWEGVLELFQTGLENGGRAGLVWGYLLVWFGTLSIFTSISELASMAPTAGGQYHWVSMLAPAQYRKVLGYFTGFINVVAWIATITSNGFLNGGIITGILNINYPDVEFQNYQSILIGYGCILVCLYINTVVSNLIPSIESIILVLHVMGFIVVLVVLGYMSPHIPAKEVFTSFSNGGMWPSTGLSFLIGLLGNAFSFVGADAAVHMAEEIQGADVTIPRAILGSIILNGIMGFGITLGVVFGIEDVDQLLNTPTGYPFIQVFLNATNSIGGTTALTVIIILSLFFCGIGFIATASRLLWSFARDEAVPFSRYLSEVNKRTSIPLRAVLVATTIGGLLLLIAFGSTLALNIILSVSLLAYYLTYFISCALLLWRRCRGDINGTYDGNDFLSTSEQSNDAKNLCWGPFRLPRTIGIINNAYACAWMLLVMFFILWPAQINPSLAAMNWTIVITCGFLILGAVYYWSYGKNHYKGPVNEMEIRW